MHSGQKAVVWFNEVTKEDVASDTYILDKDGLEITSKEIAVQEWKLIRSEGSKNEKTNVKVALASFRSASQLGYNLSLSRLGYDWHYQRDNC